MTLARAEAGKSTRLVTVDAKAHQGGSAEIGSGAIPLHKLLRAGRPIPHNTLERIQG